MKKLINITFYLLTFVFNQGDRFGDFMDTYTYRLGQCVLRWIFGQLCGKFNHQFSAIKGFVQLIRLYIYWKYIQLVVPSLVKAMSYGMSFANAFGHWVLVWFICEAQSML